MDAQLTGTVNATLRWMGVAPVVKIRMMSDVSCTHMLVNPNLPDLTCTHLFNLEV